jgi:hypothetical protein
MLDMLALLTRTVLVQQSTPAPHPTNNIWSELKLALPPRYDGNQQHGQAFINACQAFFWLQPDQFPEKQIKIQWAMTYMSQGRAQKWVNRIYQWEALLANVNVDYFVDWDHFRSVFRNEFYPLHADAVATNILERQTYFQGDRDVDDYLDDFRDLISESGYTSPKTIVVKFRRGLDPKIGDAVATSVRKSGPVQSFASLSKDRDRDRSCYIGIVQKTGLKPVRTGPAVFCGLGPVGNRSRLVILTKNIIYSKYYIYIY